MVLVVDLDAYFPFRDDLGIGRLVSENRYANHRSLRLDSLGDRSPATVSHVHFYFGEPKNGGFRQPRSMENERMAHQFSAFCLEAPDSWITE